MKSGESVDLTCSYSLETLSATDGVYLLKVSLYQSDTSKSYKLENIQANLQLPKSTVCSVAYSSDESGITKPVVTFNEGDSTVNCIGSERVEVEIILTGEISTSVDFVVSYDIVGKGIKTLCRFADRSVTFELNL